ncbi:hypothetical protein M501DRAFT_1007738 [Patellaria atrata CBS 101060]|uniref:RRM domain-containing protein n=1 Tax=Patellaria atrata CBS 101060 TaxID=1346257 RepID=A0A9P4S4C0_9PEZI|nr:hypothetical protein M501DRAFT_1007738 [Patellaria atrata CBS 101060]
MTPSPPEEAPEFRGKTLTPVSPKPVHFPSPSNIPILQQQMDPQYETSMQMNASRTAYQPYPQNEYQPPPSNITYSNQGSDNRGSISHASNDGNRSSNYAHSVAFGNGGHNQDNNSFQNFVAPNMSVGDTPNDAYANPSQMTQNPNANGPMGSLNNSYTGMDIQALLDNLNSSNPPAAPPSADPSVQSAAPTNLTSSSSALPGNPSLPPRPPPQEKPATHPNYAPGDDIRQYHPHSQKNPGASYRAQGALPALNTNATGVGMNPVSATYQQPTPKSASHKQSPSSGIYRQREPIDRRGEREPPDEDDVPWGPDVQREYDEFLRDERVYVTEGQWDKFPPNSRLFIGNLPTEKVTKRDLFHVFHKHGKLAQISLKQAYGFVQFLEADACYEALQEEQGMMVRGRKMHLEISKPQKNARNADGNARGGARRRSRSPDYTRGGTGSQQGPRAVDRYTSDANMRGPNASPRSRDFRRGRDDYRPGRSPSPRGYGRNRSRDRYDGRRRSRSRSPYGYRDRHRSPTPRRDVEDDLPLPYRAPRDVPEVQLLVLDNLDRAFITYVEDILRGRDIHVDVLLLSPRLDEAAVVRRQILEGVLGVSKLTYKSQQTGKIPLQLFDRRAGADNVQFTEYDNLDPSICAELVIQAKQTHAAPSVSYAPPQVSYGLPPPIPHQQAPVAPAGTDISNIVSSLTSPDLQKLLGALQQPPSQAAQRQAPPPSTIAPDLTRLLSNTAPLNQQGNSRYPQQMPQPSQAYNPYGSVPGNPHLASILSNVPPSATPQQSPNTQAPPDMNKLMEQLTNYNRR